jgi:uncharacterized protein YcbK (DUF882 family)
MDAAPARMVNRKTMVLTTSATLTRREALLGLGISLFLGRRALAAPSAPRRLALKNQATGETFAGFYRDADGPIPGAMIDLAEFLRDFHANKTGPVDVDSLDFLADVMAAIGAEKGYVLSAYRTPETNQMLAETTFGVAEKSQHLLGRAIDVSFERHLGEAARIARKMERGGVGWYPHSHFIHIDSGPVRSWRMDWPNLGGVLVARAGTVHRSGHRYARHGGRLPVVVRGSTRHATRHLLRPGDEG